MRNIYLLLFAICACALGVSAQEIVTTSPSPLQEGSENVQIFYHANLGNQQLKGLSPSAAVYAHVGVVTNLSDGGWAYAPTWGDNAAKYKLSYYGTDTWKLEIGDIRSFFGITNPQEQVQRLAFVFRNADCSREGKTANGGDIFVDVMPEGFHLSLSSDAPLVLNSQTATVTFTATTTAAADIELFIGSTDSEPIASAKDAKSLTKSYTFAQSSSADVIARATHAGGSATETMHICYPDNSDPMAYPGGTPQMGAVAAPNGDVTFCLAAPGKTNAMIIGAWNGYKATAQGVMHYADVNGIRYFWTTVSGLDPDTEYPYYYLVDQSIKVGDPYARLVLDPYNDKWLSDGTYPGLIPYPADEVKDNVMLAVYKGNRDKYAWKVKDFRGPSSKTLSYMRCSCATSPAPKAKPTATAPYARQWTSSTTCNLSASTP